MTPKQSLARKQSLIRRYLAVLGAAMLTVAWTLGISIPANAAAVKGFLKIVSVTNTNLDDRDLGVLVQGKAFDVAVTVVDSAGQPTTVNKETKIVLTDVTVNPAGELGGVTTAVIPRNGSAQTISGATYSKYANNVKLAVSVLSGVELGQDAATNPVTVDFALTAVDDDATPGEALDLKDTNCSAPTEVVRNCGELRLPRGASGHVTLSVGSCKDLGCSEGALLVTAVANLKNAGKQIYDNLHPATLIVACDKDLCRTTANGVPFIKVHYTLDNTGSVTTEAPACLVKGVLNEGVAACVDYVSSSRQQGDVYLHLLFNTDIRASSP